VTILVHHSRHVKFSILFIDTLVPSEPISHLWICHAVTGNVGSVSNMCCRSSGVPHGKSTCNTSKTWEIPYHGSARKSPLNEISCHRRRLSGRACMRDQTHMHCRSSHHPGIARLTGQHRAIARFVCAIAQLICTSRRWLALRHCGNR
jgi:hypothetical protein